MPKIEDAPKSEEVVETTVIETEEKQSPEDRVDALEKVVLAQGEQIADIAEEQEKIVDILEKISDKMNSQNVEKKVEVAEEKVDEVTEDIPAKENSIEEQVENDISEESSEKETEETEAETEESEVEETKEEETDEAEDEESEAEEKTENSITEESETPESDEEVEESDESEEEQEEEDAEQKEPQEIKENKMTDEQINALKEQIKNEILDEQVKAPAIEETEPEAEKEPEVEKNWRKRYNDQVAAAWNAYRLHNIDAAQKLAKINKFNFEEKLAKNAEDSDAIEVMTIETADDFVLPYEVDRMIHGKRTNYQPLLKEVDYQTTDRLTFAYATRVGDIDMQNVALCDDGEDGNLKPISTYELKKGVAQMEELAAVTPICDNATKYLAVDILADVAAGYRNDYDRKLAQLVIVRMQQAVNKSGNSVEMSGTSSVEKLIEFIKATTAVSDDVVNGKFVFNAKTKAQLVEYLFSAAANGELGKDTMTTGDFPTIFGYPYVVVPNDLMPTLGTDEVKSFKAMNNETGNVETVNITSPVFYGDLDEFRGKVSGGLKYDVSAEAAYEVADGSVRSAWQRNELVLRGSFLRGGYIANQAAFAGLTPVSE